MRPLVFVLTAGSEPRNLNPKIVSGTIRKPFDVQLLIDTIVACGRTLGGLQQPDDCPPPDGDVGQSADEPN